jgi:hypothetical protein
LCAVLGLGLGLCCGAALGLGLVMDMSQRQTDVHITFFVAATERSGPSAVPAYLLNLEAAQDMAHAWSTNN